MKISAPLLFGTVAVIAVGLAGLWVCLGIVGFGLVGGDFVTLIVLPVILWLGLQLFSMVVDQGDDFRKGFFLASVIPLVPLWVLLIGGIWGGEMGTFLLLFLITAMLALAINNLRVKRSNAVGSADF